MKNKASLIPLEWEDHFREEFEWRWKEGKTAQEIFDELQFDDEANCPWAPLKMYHVYYFARKWKLKSRNQRSISRVL